MSHATRIVRRFFGWIDTRKIENKIIQKLEIRLQEIGGHKAIKTLQEFRCLKRREKKGVIWCYEAIKCESDNKVLEQISYEVHMILTRRLKFNE